MWQEFILLFTNMGWISLTLLIMGFLLIGIELFVPGFGVFGVLGIVSFFFSIIARAIEGASVTQVSIFIILCIVVLALIFSIMILGAKKGWFSRTGLVDNGTAVEMFLGSDKELLIGKEGKIKSICRPAGTVEIEGKVFDCESVDGFLKVGEQVVVDRIKNESILVKKMEDK